MKLYLIIIFSLLPYTAFGTTIEEQTNINSASVVQCYSNLNASSTAPDIKKSISCLSNNAFAGSDDVSNFISAKQNLIENFRSIITDDLNELINQKQYKIYILIVNDNSQYLLVPDEYEFFYPLIKVKDPTPLHMTIVTKNSLFGTDDFIDLTKVKSIKFINNGPNVPGKLTTTTNDNTTVVDNFYHGSWPIRAYYSNDKHYAAINAIIGTAYIQKLNNTSDASIDHGVHFTMNAEHYSGSTVYFISENRAKELINNIEKLVTEKNNYIMDRQRKELEEITKKNNEIYINISTNLTAMQKEKIGAEDQCSFSNMFTRKINYTITNYHLFSCQFGGLIAYEELTKAGWLITNKTKDQYGNITDIYIKKIK
jgi:hypothetical protein